MSCCRVGETLKLSDMTFLLPLQRMADCGIGKNESDGLLFRDCLDLHIIMDKPLNCICNSPPYLPNYVDRVEFINPTRGFFHTLWKDRRWVMQDYTVQTGHSCSVSLGLICLICTSCLRISGHLMSLELKVHY